MIHLTPSSKATQIEQYSQASGRARLAALGLILSVVFAPTLAVARGASPAVEGDEQADSEPPPPTYGDESESELVEDPTVESPSASDEVVPPNNSHSSGEDARNTLYLELFGPGLLYSLNYEREIVDDVNLRIGFGGAAWQGAGYFTVPLGATYSGIGNELHHFEVGATGTLIFADDSFSTASSFAFQPILGYRRQAEEGGFNFRAGLSPWITSSGILPWGYVSVGISF
jgi:hypothetical protein